MMEGRKKSSGGCAPRDHESARLLRLLLESWNNIRIALLPNVPGNEPGDSLDVIHPTPRRLEDRRSPPFDARSNRRILDRIYVSLACPSRWGWERRIKSDAVRS